VCLSVRMCVCATVCACERVYVSIYMCLCVTECVEKSTRQIVFECV